MVTETSSEKGAREVCETLLRAERSDRVDKGILPSEVKVIDRLLARGLELNDAYEELHDKLSPYPPALKVFFDQLLSIAAFWSPEANQEARKGRARLVEVNSLIERSATELVKLLNERTELENHSGFSCDTYYHPVDVLDAAAKGNYSYQQWVKEKLGAVRCQFDLKYWPSLSECIQAIAQDAGRATPQPHDSVTDAGTENTRAGLADSFKAFFVALEESSTKHHGFLPRSFEPTDRSIAVLMSCALGLDAEEVVDSTYVKRLRQRQRERERIRQN